MISPIKISPFNRRVDGISGVAPANTVAPVVTAPSFEVGQTLTCSDGIWTGTAPITYSYQWQEEFAPGFWSNRDIDVNNTLILVYTDISKTLRCLVSATNAYGSDTAISNTVVIVFSPSELSPTIWLNARSEDYTLISSRISQWTATNGSNATQGTAANRPLTAVNGTSTVVDFDSSTRWLNLNSTLSEVVNSANNTDGFEVWSIIKLDDGRTGTPVYFGARTATKLYFQLFHGGAGKLRWFLGDTVGTDARALTVNSVFPIGQTDWALVRLVHKEATTQMEIHVNGVNMSLDATQNGVTSALNFNNYNPANNIYLNGVNNAGTQSTATSGMLFGDFIAFNKLLTEEEAIALTNYYI